MCMSCGFGRCALSTRAGLMLHLRTYVAVVFKAV